MGVLALGLASCSSIQTIKDGNLQIQENNLNYQKNQQALNNIKFFDVTGAVGIRAGSKPAVSSDFRYQKGSGAGYDATIIYPITGKTAKIKRADSGLYTYTDANGKSYSTYDYEFLSNALFQTYVPLDILNRILLGQDINKDNSDPAIRATTKIQNDVIAQQVYNLTTTIKYSDYRLVDGKYLIPFLLNVSQFNNLVKIRLNDNATVVNGKLVVVPEE